MTCSLLYVTLLLLAVGFAAGEIKNKGWWKNTVFYQIYPRSFMDGNGDGIGDLKGVTEKLEHFVDAGVGAIWLSPINTSPMADFGYDVADFRNIDPTFGTLEDFALLLQKAKKLGIKVIMDLVPNHTSDQHYWFQQSLKGTDKYKDYYVWRQGLENNTKPPNNWVNAFSGSAWTYNAGRGLWYLHQFDPRQPDLNFDNADVRREMEEIITYWLEKGIDGFRIDAVAFIYENEQLLDEPRSNTSGAIEGDYAYLRHDYTKNDPRMYPLVQSWRNLMDNWSDLHNHDEIVMMTEVYQTAVNVTKMYKYGSNVPFNFDFIMTITNKSSPLEFKNIINDWVSNTPANCSANWVICNHDRHRTPSRYPGRGDQMTMLTMVLPGIAVTYYGEEIAMVDYNNISWADTIDTQACRTSPERYMNFSRDPFRTPFQWDDTTNSGFSNATKTWLPVNTNYKQLNLAKQKRDPETAYKLYQTLTKLRKSSKALIEGTLNTEVLQGNGNGTLAILRQVDEESVLLLINFSDDQTQKINIHTKCKNLQGNVVVSSVGSNIKWGSKVHLSNVVLPPKISVVLKIKTRKASDITL